MVKLLHISDLHLGKAFPFLGNKGKAMREAQRETFLRVIEVARQEEAAAVLIAGDLFDSNGAGKVLTEVQQAMDKSGLDFYLLPGSGQPALAGHDALVPGSVYLRESWNELAKVHIFKKEGGETFFDPATGIAFYGKPVLHKGQSPLPVLDRHPFARYHVALAHGSISTEGRDDDYPITRREIENSGFDYLALGHWHTPADYSTGKTKAHYCGSTEILSPDQQDRQGRGTALLITFLDNDVLVSDPIEVGTFFWIALSMTIENKFPPLHKIIKNAIKEPGRTVLSLRLTGEVPMERLNHLLATVKDATRELFHVFVDTTEIIPRVDSSSYPDSTVAGQFVKAMEAQLAEAQGEEAEVYREALRTGLGLLTGTMDKKALSLKDFLR